MFTVTPSQVTLNTTTTVQRNSLVSYVEQKKHATPVALNV
jgi:hypothetical protein